MNIDDVKDTAVPKDVVPAIFQHQHELTLKYADIEVKNGANFPSEPWNIDDKFVQWRLKDLFWRVTEELAEALDGGGFDGMYDWQTKWESDTNVRHFFEELADALHFLVEASLMTEMNAHNIEIEWDHQWNHYDRNSSIKRLTSSTNIEKQCASVVWQLGLAANCLKNKPWKLTHMQTDVDRYTHHMYEAWTCFIRLWSDLGCSKETVYQLYFKKNAVNQFRQRSNY